MDIQARLREMDIGGLLTVGNPNSPLLEMPAGMDKTGVLVVGDLNPIAALYEQGIETQSFAMAELVSLEELKPVKETLQSLD
jgi:repressor of nif and glnA expression